MKRHAIYQLSRDKVIIKEHPHLLIAIKNTFNLRNLLTTIKHKNIRDKVRDLSMLTRINIQSLVNMQALVG